MSAAFQIFAVPQADIYIFSRFAIQLSNISVSFVGMRLLFRRQFILDRGDRVGFIELLSDDDLEFRS